MRRRADNTRDNNADEVLGSDARLCYGVYWDNANLQRGKSVLKTVIIRPPTLLRRVLAFMFGGKRIKRDGPA